MTHFQPSFSFWPPPCFLGDSHNGLAAWIARQDGRSNTGVSGRREPRSIRRIIEDYHDHHGRTLARGVQDAE